jgi:FkbM family methyltransferase
MASESEIFEILAKYINKEDVCVDIGANVGVYTKFFLRELKGTGMVYSVELFPKTFNELANEVLHWPNLKMVNCAISDVDGEVKYYLGSDNSTNNIIGHDMNFRENKEIGYIKSMRMDTLLEEEKHIRLIKIDVEGAEIQVLKGMTETFKKTDLIFLECHLDKDWPELAEMLMNQNDFEVFIIGSDKMVSIDDPRPYHALCKRKGVDI